MPTTPRKDSLETGEIYHVMNKSIAGFRILNTQNDYLRMRRMLQYFQVKESLPKFSQFFELSITTNKGFDDAFLEMTLKSKRHTQLIAYCLMPTHVHFVVKQLSKNGISRHMANLLNSYARYFNIRHDRRGPLWVGRFKSVRVKTDKQLLHLTRYLHLNPTTAELVKRPSEWEWSSYWEYVDPTKIPYRLCDYRDLLNITSHQYKSFVNDYIGYQRNLAKIKQLVLD